MTQIWAHRGARAEAPENTLPAFELAIAQGADGIELDVQLTADGEMVVIHDETVERTTDGHGRVVAYDLAQLQRLDASRGLAAFRHRRAAGDPGLRRDDVGGSDVIPGKTWDLESFAGVQIPTLDQVLALMAPTTLKLNIELKNSVEEYPGLEEKVLDAIERFGLAERVVLSSFNHYSLKKLQDLGTTCELGMLYTDPLYRPWRYARQLKVGAIHPPSRYLTSGRFIRKAHARGLAVRPWVVNGERKLTRMFRWGADAVFTDYPAKALALREISLVE